MVVLVAWAVLSAILLGYNAIPPEYLYLGTSMMLAAQYIVHSRKRGDE